MSNDRLADVVDLSIDRLALVDLPTYTDALLAQGWQAEDAETSGGRGGSGDTGEPEAALGMDRGGGSGSSTTWRHPELPSAMLVTATSGAGVPAIDLSIDAPTEERAHGLYQQVEERLSQQVAEGTLRVEAADDVWACWGDEAGEQSHESGREINLACRPARALGQHRVPAVVLLTVGRREQPVLPT